MKSLGKKSYRIEIPKTDNNIFLRVGADDGYGVAVLEDFLIAQNGAVPAVALVGGEP